MSREDPGIWTDQDAATELATALESHQLQLYFQPTVSLSDRSSTWLEGLPRWDHPERGIIGPAGFIEQARHNGQLEALEGWAIREAMQQLALWSTGTAAQLSISVNLSGQHAFGSGLIKTVRANAEQAGVSMHRLGIEIAEATMKQASEADIGALSEIADLGINLTIDDFRGRLGLPELRQMPIGALKISRAVIDGVPDDSARLSIATQAVEIGRDLGLAVIATGIENPGQATALREIGCRFGQGFLFSVPMPAEVLEERLLDH